MASKKYINLNPDILLEYEYNSTNISENYSVLTNLTTNIRSFMSTTNLNNIDNTLFPLDLVIKKFSKPNFSIFNFLKIQDYSTPVITYDKVTVYIPTSYNFDVYLGFYLKISALDFTGKIKYPISNFYFDKSQIQTINGSVVYADSLMTLGTPFIYNQKEWGKYITYYIPSISDVSNQRYIDTTSNKVTPDSINDHLTNGIGLNLNAPIYLDFSFITSKQTVFSVPYYYMGDIYSTSISIQPEYQTLGVTVQESTQGDFFEIFGYYNNSNENLDNFVSELESKGRRINIEYIVTLYEENFISGFPVTFLVDEHFSQKIEYRPIIKYSNTTAAIDVEMKIIDLVDDSSFSKFASIGLTTNLLKYGKTLSKLDVSNIYSPKIYNYKYDKIYDFKTSSNVTDVNIIKVPFPILIDVYKILATNYNPSVSTDYKSMGLLNMILTPFDNIIKFQIAKQDSASSDVVPYNLSEILLNSKLNLVFMSDKSTIEKEIYYQTDENKFNLGIVVFKVNQEDMPILKQMSKDKSDNFYIILNSNKTKTLLYSGKFKIFDNLKFLAPTTPTVPTVTAAENTLVNVPGVAKINQSLSNLTLPSTTIDGGTVINNINAIVPPQFDADGIPVLTPGARGTLDSYKNLIVWAKAGLTTAQIDEIKNNLIIIGVNINYAYQTPTDTGPYVIILERVEVEKISRIRTIPNVANVKEIPLDLGWNRSTTGNINIINTSGGTYLQSPPVPPAGGLGL